MGEAGRRRVEEHFAWSAIARRTADLYRALVTTPPAAAQADQPAPVPSP